MIRILLSLIATVAAAVQTWHILKTGDAFCFNDGCNVVEQMTTVPTLYFYACATGFFLLIFLASFSYKFFQSKPFDRFVNMLLTAAFAAEGILIFYQYAIAHTFCSSCLVVLALIVLLNLSGGIWQFIKGFSAFAAVLIASFSLQFSIGGNNTPLSSGTMAEYHEEGNNTDILLIFSQSCPHCLHVIDFLREESYCNVAFNPYEKLQKFDFPGVTLKGDYNPAATQSFMKNMGLRAFPLLVVPRNDGGKEILQGESSIIDYLKKHCRIPEQPEIKDDNGKSTVPQNDRKFLLPETVPVNECQEGTKC